MSSMITLGSGNIEGNIQQQQHQKCQHDAYSQVRTFKPNDNVLVRNFRTAGPQ